MQPRYTLRDLRILALPDCDARMILALVAIACGIKRDQLRILMHQYDFRFTNTEYTKWRQVVYSASCLSDEAKTWEISTSINQTDETIAHIKMLKMLNVSREDARNIHGFSFTNTDWTDV